MWIAAWLLRLYVDSDQQQLAVVAAVRIPRPTTSNSSRVHITYENITELN